MLKIRFQRKGRKRLPVFRLVVAEHTMPVQGRFIEKLGMFVAGQKKETLDLKKDRILYWLSVGAQPSQTAARLLAKEGMKEFEAFIEKRKQVPSKAEVKAKTEAIEAEEKKKEEAKVAAEEKKKAKEDAEVEAKEGSDS
jgi:small subunit ribosomal protein S16